MGVDLRSPGELPIADVCRFIESGFCRAAAAPTVAGIIEHQQRRGGRTEVADDRPNSCDCFAVAVKPEQCGKRRGTAGAGGLRRGRRGHVPANQVRPILHLQLDAFTVTECLYRIRYRCFRGGERDPLLHRPQHEQDDEIGAGHGQNDSH